MGKNSTTIMSGPEIADKLRAYISEHFMADFSSEINDDTDLFKAGIIDSFGFVELVLFLEKTFLIKFSGEELVAGGLSNITNMVASIKGKISA